MILRAADKGDDQLGRVCRVVGALDDFKLRVHLGQERQAFTSFKRVQIIAELAVTVGRQRGSWRKRLTPFRLGPGFRASPDAMGFALLSLSCKPLLSL
jgi:hypothetical protein